MNALSNSMQKTALQVSRRFASAATAAPKAPFVPEMYNYSFKKNYLSNPGVYPLIAVLASASCFVVGMSTNRLMYSKRIRITPESKHAVIQHWGTEHVQTVTKTFSKEPVAFNAQHFKSIRQEGIGVDHEEWKKGKEAYSRGS